MEANPVALVRMPAVRIDSVLDIKAMRRVAVRRLLAQESGGEVARVELPAPMAWEASLGSLSLRALTNKRTTEVVRMSVSG